MALLSAQRHRLERLQGRLEGSPALVALDRDRRLGGSLLAAALAFRLFGVLLPLALLVAVGLGHAATVDRSAPAEAGAAVGIREATLRSIAESSRLNSGTRWLVAAFAVATLLYAAVKAARAIRAVHSLAWTAGVERGPRPVRAGLLLLAALVAVALVWAVVGRARAELGAAGLVVLALAGVPYVAIWLGVSLLLPHDRAPWTALLPGAVLVAAGLEIIQVGSVLFVSGQVQRASATYGPLGAAFAILIWLFVIGRVIVGAAMLNAALWRRSSHHPAPEERRGDRGTPRAAAGAT